MIAFASYILERILDYFPKTNVLFHIGIDIDDKSDQSDLFGKLYYNDCSKKINRKESLIYFGSLIFPLVTMLYKFILFLWGMVVLVAFSIAFIILFVYKLSLEIVRICFLLIGVNASIARFDRDEEFISCIKFIFLAICFLLIPYFILFHLILYITANSIILCLGPIIVFFILSCFFIVFTHGIIWLMTPFALIFIGASYIQDSKWYQRKYRKQIDEPMEKELDNDNTCNV